MKEDIWVKPGAETIRRDYAAHTGDKTAYDLTLRRYVVNPQTIGVN